jgi:23S rRNA (cytidine1920-2'-O)/16S rRNA (cytidine1409-2'-O)-methyltransferase
VKKRLDELLVEKGMFESRTKAHAIIMAGLILVNEQKMEKPGVKVDDTSVIRVLGDSCPYVSRGGLKMEKALNEFKVDVAGMTVADIGAGTGGFTDCILKRGAKKVYAIDVGYGQIDWKLRKDPQVVVIEKKNAREMTLEDIGEKVDLIVMDVSFISILKVLPALTSILKDTGTVVSLIKPQFEIGKGNVPMGGVIKDDAVRNKVLADIKTGVEKLGFAVLNETTSPIQGHDGNVEFFLHLRKLPANKEI